MKFIDTIALGRAWSASARSRRSASCSTMCRRTSSDLLQPRRGAADRASSCCRCCSKGTPRRSSSWLRCTPSAPASLAFLDLLTQSIGAVFNTIEATMRTEGLLDAVPAAHRGAAVPPARTAADQRGAGHQGQAAGRAERGGRTQERGSRAGATRAGGEGGRAGADLEVQVRVPGEHVARTAHAAQLHPDPQPAARPRTRPATCPPSRWSSRATSTPRAPTCCT